MTDQPRTEIITVQLGALDVPHQQVIEKATAVAEPLAQMILDRKLYTNIKGKKFVNVEGWNTLGVMLGILPRESWVKEHEDGSFEAYVDLIRISDGVTIGGASAYCGTDERTWANRDKYARRSMAVTRATSKAFRLGFSWIMKLAGYEATPAEEMIDGDFTEVPPEPVEPNKKYEIPKPQTSKDRPYTPENLRNLLNDRATKAAGKTVNAKQRGLVAGMLKQVFGDDVARHAVQKYLLGHASLNDVPDQMVYVVLDEWLKPEKDNGGEYHPDPMAEKELNKVLEQVGVDQGQQEMELD